MKSRKKSVAAPRSEIERAPEEHEERMTEVPSWNQRTSCISPLHDVMITSSEVVVTVDLPMTQEDSLRVKPLGRDILDISAKLKRKVRLEEFGIKHHRGEFHSLHCQARIPVPVQMSGLEMQFKKGILQIHLLRTQERKNSSKRK